MYTGQGGAKRMLRITGAIYSIVQQVYSQESLPIIDKVLLW